MPSCPSPGFGRMQHGGFLKFRSFPQRNPSVLQMTAFFDLLFAQAMSIVVDSLEVVKSSCPLHCTDSHRNPREGYGLERHYGRDPEIRAAEEAYSELAAAVDGSRQALE